jgi:hypothetical protein
MLGQEVALKRQHIPTKLHCVIFSLLECYAALIGIHRRLMGPTFCHSASVASYQLTLRDIPDDQRSHLHGLKSYTVLRL